jgi:hypothetical protein
VQLSHGWSKATPSFDDERLVSFAGLARVMALAERAGLSELVSAKVAINTTKVKSAAVNPAGKVTAIIAGMAAGADSIDDLDVIRSGGMPQLFDGVYACSTLGQFLREFTHGHSLQLASVLRAHLVGLIEHSHLLPRIETQSFIDIDSLLRPVYGHQKQGASYGHAKIAGRQLLRKGLSPVATTISTHDGAPVIAGIRLRAGKAGSGKGAASMVKDAIRTARAAGANGEVLARGDSAYGNSSVINACLKAGVHFSFVLIKNPAVAAAIASIGEDAWQPVHCPGAVIDPDTGELISDAHVAEVQFTAFASTKHPVTARLIVRRVRDRARTDELVPVYRHHPFLTNSLEATAQADISHRRHAIIETVFADLIDGPLAHQPSGHFSANSAWAICAAMTHNLLRAAGTLTSERHAVAPRCDPAPPPHHRPSATGPTTTTARAAPARALALGQRLDHVLARRVRDRDRVTGACLTLTIQPQGQTETTWNSWADQRNRYACTEFITKHSSPRSSDQPVHGSRLSGRLEMLDSTRSRWMESSCCTSTLRRLSSGSPIGLMTSAISPRLSAPWRKRFFTLLGYSPFLMHLSPLRLGAVFCGWGVLVALFAVFGAPWLKFRFGTPAASTATSCCSRPTSP